jgi:hypothetical protein
MSDVDWKSAGTPLGVGVCVEVPLDELVGVDVDERDEEAVWDGDGVSDGVCDGLGVQLGVGVVVTPAGRVSHTG